MYATCCDQVAGKEKNTIETKRSRPTFGLVDHKRVRACLMGRSWTESKNGSGNEFRPRSTRLQWLQKMDNCDGLDDDTMFMDRSVRQTLHFRARI